MPELRAARIQISGIVQGVGFRPFVYGLATRLALAGWVRNTSAGVEIQVDGEPAKLHSFVQALRDEAPPLARIDDLQVEPRAPNGFSAFEIVHSQPIPDAFMPVSPDVSICPDCLRELFDLKDRRYRYPFINCTNCGPRFTIIADIPYDRPNTTMASFQMCPECAAEYNDPGDRRFHAQPVACPVCGPQVWLEGKEINEKISGDSAIRETQRLLASGKIVAIKGLGGFHLACDALDENAAGELRRRKLRVDKPFALMMADIATVEAHCLVNEAEKELLESRQRPIVLLKRRLGSPISSQVAPGQDTLGVMLPYTPLHYLLFAGGAYTSEGDLGQPAPKVLVMTSGNLSEEPIAKENEEARQRLAGLADAFLMHDRPIHTRCDDSVTRLFYIENRNTGDRAVTLPLRRARGYAPLPVHLSQDLPPLLAAGAELKNTFCLTRSRYAFLSHHIGDLENYETLRSFEQAIDQYERLFRVCPEAIAYDLHPDYLATRYALERASRSGLPAYGIQHHHAHIASCMLEHGLPGDQPVIGVAFDGTGYGEDGAIWGGEFLLAGYQNFQRLAHLAMIPLPGGDIAAKEPWRLALAWLDDAGVEWSQDLPPVQFAREFAKTARPVLDPLAALQYQLRTGLNSPPTSSFGRLFDAIAALAGVRQKVNYEAQAAMELESIADPGETGAYPFDCSSSLPERDNLQASMVIDPKPVVLSVIADLRSSVPTPVIAARFHNGVTQMVVDVCQSLRARLGIGQIVLSGGVWQNFKLLNKTVAGLQNGRFTVYIHEQVPANDGGLSLGQAAVAASRLLA